MSCIEQNEKTIVSKAGCKYCSQTPVFLDGKYYDRVRSSMSFISSGYEEAFIGANEKGEIVMYVCGDDISEDMPLNFCPVCGRKLKEDK